jgi:hypothetical protein
MTGFFGWVRRKVTEAVLGGVADAARALHEAEDVEALLLEHRPEAPALPAPDREGDAPARGNGRKVKT